MRPVYFYSYQFDNPIDWREYHPSNSNCRSVRIIYNNVSNIIAPIKRGVKFMYYLRDEDEIRKELMATNDTG